MNLMRCKEGRMSTIPHEFLVYNLERT